MNNQISENEPDKGEIIVYQADDGRVRLDVRLQDETVWLTQPMMAELFQTTQQNISHHILNTYEEGELVQDATHKKFLSVRREGNRQVQRYLDFYNLDMIISVGYRVKSLIATRFRKGLETKAGRFLAVQRAAGVVPCGKSDPAGGGRSRENRI